MTETTVVTKCDSALTETSILYTDIHGWTHKHMKGHTDGQTG